MYKGIEGLRAWLAWSVVFSHIAELVGLPASIGAKFEMAATSAVMTFIIISGFVITHLIIEKNEPFSIFIARRFLRIYPAYLTALALAILTAPWSYQAILGLSEAPKWLMDFTIAQREQFDQNFTPHFLVHLALVQGIIPHAWLSQSAYMFLPPAWSLSLEWQFYFIAPFWIWALRKYPLPTIGATLILAAGYKRFLEGEFSLSFFPGAVLFFLIGIATRFWIAHAPRLKIYPYAVVAGFFGTVILDTQLIAVWIWVATVAYLLDSEKWSVVDSRIAQTAGMRSYAVYIIHYPVLMAGLSILSPRISGVPFALSLTVVTIGGTLFLSEAIHRWIEVPAINFGKSIGPPSATVQLRAVEQPIPEP
jgi:peptidoglycan/LPS O-acetylase OafA/YrhL